VHIDSGVHPASGLNTSNFRHTTDRLSNGEALPILRSCFGCVPGASHGSRVRAAWSARQTAVWHQHVSDQILGALHQQWAANSNRESLGSFGLTFASHHTRTRRSPGRFMLANCPRPHLRKASGASKTWPGTSSLWCCCPT